MTHSAKGARENKSLGWRDWTKFEKKGGGGNQYIGALH